MAESRYVPPFSGAEVREQDLQLISDDAGLADDRVLWELIRLLPGSSAPQKVILACGASGWQAPGGGIQSTALVVGNTSDGNVRVAPFRAIVGSTTPFGTSPLENLRGGRSGYLLGSSSLYTLVPLAANVSGNPRWDLVYVVVTPDAPGATVTIKKKDPTTGAVSSQTIAITEQTPVTIGVVQGTPASSPAYPALPADGAGNYYIPLAYVLLPNGFGGASAVARESIYEVAPCAAILSALGVPNIAPATQSWVPGGTVDVQQSGATSQYRPSAYLPPTLVGGEERIIPIQLGLSPASHANNSIVDDGVNWQFRIFTWTAMIIPGSTQAAGFVWDRASTGGQQNPSGPLALASSSVAHGWGQTFFDDSASATLPATVAFSASPIPNSGGIAVFIDDVIIPGLGPSGSALVLYVDTTTGKLRVQFSTTGSPSGQILIWLRASAPYSNFGILA
jgi:hypothetical protein